MADQKQTGADGEKAGLEFIKKLGYKVLEKNFRSVFGEIDLIAQDRAELVFVEIKTRLSDAYGRPFEAVDRKKQKKIIMSALDFIKRRGLSGHNVRFDVLSIEPGAGIEHIKAAFSSAPVYTF